MTSNAAPPSQDRASESHLRRDAASGTVGMDGDYTSRAQRPRYALLACLGVGAAALSLPADPAVSDALRSLRITGDLARELQAIQQFGGVTITVILCLAVALLDPRRARRLLDWGLAAGATLLLVYTLNVLIGRPRPGQSAPYTFLGPVREFPVVRGGGGDAVREAAWQSGYALLSMPSRHAALAAVSAAFLAMLYPRLRWLVCVLACIVGVMRVVTGAHYPSDVLLGWTIGALLTIACARGYWGVRLLDWFWLRFVDRDATPSYPGIMHREDTAG